MLCWYKQNKRTFDNLNESYNKKNLNLCYFNNVFSIFLWPIWWTFIFISIIMKNNDLIHVLNYNSVAPALIAGKLKRIPIIYEIMDTSYDAFVLPMLFKSIFMTIDKFFMKFSDAIVLVDENQQDQFRGIPNSRISIIYDSAPDLLKSIEPMYNDSNNSDFTIVYIGVLYKIRHLNIEKLCDIVQNIEGIQLIIAGYGDLADYIREKADHSNGKIQFLGRVSYSKALDISLGADALIVLRDSRVRTNKYICGSKIWEAMMCGKPIIINKGTSTADKVLKENCGLIIDAEDVNEIKKAIMKLRDDPELCKLLGTNGRKAYEERYSWDIMGQKLIDLYQDLTKSSDDHPLTTQKLVAKEVRK